MDNRSGTVVSLQAYGNVLRATIEVNISEFCPRCAAGRGCGAGLMGTGKQSRRIEVDLRPGFKPMVGESVCLSMAPANLLRATIVAYGLPLLGALLGAGIAYIVRAGDAGAVTLSLIGLAVGVAAGRRRLAAQKCLRQFTPSAEVLP